MENTKTIPIVMVLDRNYIIQTKVAIWSMRKSTSIETCLDIVILCSKTLEIVLRQQVLDLGTILRNLKITFYEIDETKFNNAKVTGSIPIASYYRLLIGEIINVDKCLFLDGDVIVNVDLNELFDLNLGDNYIAGVKNFSFLQNENKAQEHMKTYGFDSLDTYINAGVMLFNLQKIREDKMQSIFLEEVNNKYIFMDQDILNKVCYRRIKILEPEYNVPACHVQFSKMYLCHGIDYNYLKSGWKILHFMGGYKPWCNVRTWGAVIWWNYAKDALDQNTWKSMYSEAQKLTKEEDWIYILEKCKVETEIVIVGYSDIGWDLYESLLRCKISAKFYFCDNSEKRQNQSEDQIKVYSVESVARSYKNALWINTSQLRYKEINSQLESLGIENKRIMVYRNKTDVYYEMLDEAYKEYEYKQLNLKNNGI